MENECQALKWCRAGSGENPLPCGAGLCDAFIPPGAAEQRAFKNQADSLIRRDGISESFGQTPDDTL